MMLHTLRGRQVRPNWIEGSVVRAFSDDELDQAAPLSLDDDAPVTAQFVIEDHALRHSWHHLALIRAAVNSDRRAKQAAA